jgi:hypothetical protein|tara:strand:- start:559 stop:1422 length:864 start_codon:yes stop_codon:yes gene_type:complete
LKIAKVITTSFVPRVVREDTGLAGSPMGYFSHSQNFQTEESVIDLINWVIDSESMCNPGYPVDLIIVNNDSGWGKGVNFLKKIDGKTLNHGKVRVLTKENYGRSFGGYNYAFKLLQDEYEYFIFTEDDIVISRDGYASIAVDVFLKTKNCGFVSYQAISNQGLNLAPEDALAAHGGVGLTSTNVLKAVAKQFGSLPHSEKGSSQAYHDIIKNGEIAFTNKIYKLGYKLISIPDNIKLYDFAYDQMRGLNVAIFPSFPVKLLAMIKMKAYESKLIRSFYFKVKKSFIG